MADKMTDDDQGGAGPELPLISGDGDGGSGGFQMKAPALYLYGPAPSGDAGLSLRRLAFEAAERNAVDSDGRRLSGAEVLKLARRYLRFLEGE